ncbi:MAG: hypothetical protein ACKOEQ_04425, partial [Verrucomicrobiota bacterium]
MKLLPLPVLARLVIACLTLAMAHAASPPAPVTKPKPLFDGKSLVGWDGDPKLWRVRDGMIVGGSLTETIRQNEFLATT